MSRNWVKGDCIGQVEGGVKENQQIDMLWVLNLSDGQHSLLDIAEQSGLELDSVRKAASALLAHGLLIRRLVLERSAAPI